jgi:hypothetical protein
MGREDLAAAVVVGIIYAIGGKTCCWTYFNIVAAINPSIIVPPMII